MSKEQVSKVSSVAPIDDSMDGLQLDEYAKKQEEEEKKSKVDFKSHVVKAECLGSESEKCKDAVSMENNGLSDAGIESKTKDKKKKKKKLEQHGSEDKPQSTIILNGCDISLEKKAKKSKEQKKKKDDSPTADGKGSKKRKRLDSDEHEFLPVDENANEESKRRKKENGDEQYTKLKPLAEAEKTCH